MKLWFSILFAVLLPLAGLAQSFSFTVPLTLLHAEPGEQIQFKNELTNLTSDTLEFWIIRTVNVFPDDTWSSQMCVGVGPDGLCYAPFTDTTFVHSLDPAASDSILLYVNTSLTTPGDAEVHIRLENVNDPMDFVEVAFLSSTNPTAIDPVSDPLAGTFQLHDNFPNPFNPSTTLRFEIASLGAQHVQLAVYDQLGRQVALLADESLLPGVYELTWDARDSDGNELGSGIYFYTLTAGSERLAKQMVLVR